MVTEARQRAADLNKQITFDSMERAYKDGMNFSRWLEKQDPSSEYKDGMDAFERQLAVMDITTTSNPERGFYADRLEAFTSHGEAGRVLMIEWMARQYRKVSQASSRVLTSDSSTAGSMMKPFIDAAQARMSQMAPAIPLSELVATRSQIEGNVYRALYLESDSSKHRMVRVGELAEIPGVTVTEGEHTTTLYKYGRKVTSSYEALRRVPIDRVAHIIMMLAVQAEIDKVSTVIDVLVNGDGNSGTAAEVIDITALDSDAPYASGSSGPRLLTLKAWLAFKLKFHNPYALTHELVREDVLLQQLLLNTGSANIPVLSLTGAANFGGFAPMNQTLAENVRYGITEDAPDNKILALDPRFAVEQVSEIGGTITESMNWITRQARDLVFTEVEGYNVIDSKAAKILDLSK